MKANILIDETGAPRINDFGISRLVDSSSLWKTSRTSANGTIRWMSPELITGTDPHPTTESDVYAFAMTIIVGFATSVYRRETKFV